MGYTDRRTVEKKDKTRTEWRIRMEQFRRKKKTRTERTKGLYKGRMKGN